MDTYRGAYEAGGPPIQPCPVCAAPPDLRTWQDFMTEQYFRLRSPNRPLLGSMMRPLVCTSCGYVQIFADPKDFRQ